jgi:hypothetical protein
MARQNPNQPSQGLIDYLEPSQRLTLDCLLLSKLSDLEDRMKAVEREPQDRPRFDLVGIIDRATPGESYTSTDVPSSGRSNTEMDIWREQVLFFETIKGSLLQNPSFLGRYVAIKEKNVIDSDINDIRLARRIQQQFPGEVVVILKVEKHSPIIEIPSPEYSR